MNAFTESQTYGALLDLIGILALVLTFLFLWKFAAKKIYVLITVPFALLLCYFIFVRLDTRIDSEGIHYRMFPSERSVNDLAWDQVDRIIISNYMPYSRGRSMNSGLIYGVFDNYGMYVHRKDGRVVVIGTRKPEELKKILTSLGQPFYENNKKLYDLW